MMKKLLAILAALALTTALAHAQILGGIGRHPFGVRSSTPFMPNNGVTYYVDPDLGLDTNDGLQKVSDGNGHGPWKNPPGAALHTENAWYLTFDCALSGTTPQTTTFHAGDKVSFKGGTVTRAMMAPRVSGTGNAASGNSFYLVGNEWPTADGATASFSGADPVQSVVPCPSAAACGNNPNWANLSLITYYSTSYMPAFFSCDNAKCTRTTMLYYVQNPKSTVTAPPNSQYWWDDVSTYYNQGGATFPQATYGAAFAAGSITGDTTDLNALTTSYPGGGVGSAWFWVYDASYLIVEQQSLTSVSGSTINFVPPSGYSTDAAGPRFALVNVPSLVSVPMEIATIGGNTCNVAGSPCQAVAYLPSPSYGVVNTNARIGFCNGTDAIHGRDGIMASGYNAYPNNYWYISGFDFHDYSDAFGETRNGIGVSVGYSDMDASTPIGIDIENNTFKNFAGWGRNADVQLKGVKNTTVKNNVFTYSMGQTAILFTHADGAEEISGNVITYTGKTGIDMYGPINVGPGYSGGLVSIHDNLIYGGHGAHGNGISMYETNVTTNGVTTAYSVINANVFNNTLHSQSSPVTLQPDNGTLGWHFYNNIFMSYDNPGNLAAVTYYAGAGAPSGGAAQDGNLYITANAPAIKASETYTNITATYNYQLTAYTYGCNTTDANGQMMCTNTWGVAWPTTWTSANNGMTVDPSMALLATITPHLDDPIGTLNPLPAAICAVVKEGQTGAVRIGANFVCN